MTISTALNSALSGLGAASRSAQVVSSNISNALTPGYARREIDLASGQWSGVRVAGVSRSVDPAILSERRGADARAGFAQFSSASMGRLASALGTVGSPDGLAGRVAQFDALLLEAASQPASTTRLEALAHGAGELATFLNTASADIQSTRRDADTSIANQVSRLNDGLARIDELNGEILTSKARGSDLNALKDARQREIDGIADIVPLRILPRPNDGVSILTMGGQILLENSPVTIELGPPAVPSAPMLQGGPVNGLTIDGRPVDMGRAAGRMSGGTLQAAFQVRDTLGPEAQARLDGLARDLVERFSGVDSTVAPGNPGLFTDGGNAFAAANEAGLAERIALNAIVDPDQVGEVWRLRDGLGAAAPGPQGDATLLQTLRNALNAPSAASSTALGTAVRDFGGQADDLMSILGGQLLRAESDTSFAQAQLSELTRQELERGVDTDVELQNLLLIEQIYGANTKVVQAADAMLQRILEI